MKTGAVVFLLGLCACVSAQAAKLGGSGPIPPGREPGVYKDDDDYLLRKFREDVSDPATGLPNDKLREGVVKLAAELRGKEDWRVVKARAYAWTCDNMAIGCSGHDWFPAFASWHRYRRPLSPIIWDRERNEIDAKFLSKEVAAARAGEKAGKYVIWKDFDHSIPDWDDIFRIGWPGISARLDAMRDDSAYWLGLKITLDATLRVFRRIGETARAEAAKVRPGTKGHLRLTSQAAAIDKILSGPPETTYEAMLFQFVYFVLCEHIDHMQVKSFGCYDQVMTPFYRRDVAAGRIDEVRFRELLKHFWWQFGSIDCIMGHPIYVGGTFPDGSSGFNDVTWMILDVHDQLALPTPKMLVKVAKNTPERYMDKMMAMARAHRSIAFVGEESLTRALKAWRNCTDEDCRTAELNGCYEFYVRGEQNVTQSAHLSFLQPVADVLKRAEAGEFSAATFGEFKKAYADELRKNAVECMDIVNAFERHLEEINPANLATVVSPTALGRHKDAYADGMKYNDTALLTVGLGTAVDALLAVKELVYEKRTFSLSELGSIMSADWNGHEDLRLRMLRSKRKWGTNDAEANSLGKEVARCVAEICNGKPNSRGGIWGLSGHPALNFIWLAKRTGATPDGRKAGDESSKNCSPTMGADSEGATAVVRTLAALDPADLPVNLPLDMQLLPASVMGEKGLLVMKTLVREFFANGGLSMHFNVLSLEELKDAQRQPEKYENLQVRICGWNVRWNELSKFEQDAYIRRAENLAQ